MTVLVVGVGNPDRGDDAVGPAVAHIVRGLALPGVRVADSDGDPAVLLGLWEGRSRVVLVDAVASGAAPGTVVVRDVRRAPLACAPTTSTHGFGLGEAVELARALGRLPRELFFVGVELAGVEAGAAVSPPVLAGVSEAADRVAGLALARLPDADARDLLSMLGASGA